MLNMLKVQVMTALACVLHRGVAAEKGMEELFLQPLSLPKAPARYYYLFGKPIETRPEDMQQRGRCQEMYRCAPCK
jgi:hypothetical protein